ncbi:hypothetical protein [Phenylobacterium sp.]|uniref:hypothetical protein n=1 Tax=Phenylobacterium sp. TaxID=1871053 RepID=UPI002FC70D47
MGFLALPGSSWPQLCTHIATTRLPRALIGGSGVAGEKIETADWPTAPAASWLHAPTLATAVHSVLVDGLYGLLRQDRRIETWLADTVHRGRFAPGGLRRTAAGVEAASCDSQNQSTVS